MAKRGEVSRNPFQCGKLIKKQGMSKSRPCLHFKSHKGPCSPDLKGLKNVYGYLEVLRRGPNSRFRCVQWVMKDKFGSERLITARNLFRGNSTGIKVLDHSGLGSRSKSGKFYPEYRAISSHYYQFHNRPYARKMAFFDDWNPDKGGSLVVGTRWIRENLGPKPGTDFQLHVLKTKKYPYGYFGPGGIVWRHKMDRHDQDLLDLIHEWSPKKLHKFVQHEIQPLLRAA